LRKENFNFKSANKKTDIYTTMWLPDSEPTAILQIAHGITEHMGRYEDLAKYFVDKNIAVVGIDLLGHGHSVYSEEEKSYFGEEGSWNLVVSDLHTCKEKVKEKFSNIPYVLMGFSLGSFLVRTYLSVYHEDDIDAAILMGTGQKPGLVLKVIYKLVKREGKKIGENNSSTFIKKLSFDSYNKVFSPNKTDCDWLCSDGKSLEDYLNDELCYREISAGLFRELLGGMIFTSNMNNIKKIDSDMPILLISGGDDPVGDQGKGIDMTKNSLEKAGIKKVDVKIYTGLRHDILHEACREEVYEYLYKWIIGNIKM